MQEKGRSLTHRKATSPCSKATSQDPKATSPWLKATFQDPKATSLPWVPQVECTAKALAGSRARSERQRPLAAQPHLDPTCLSSTELRLFSTAFNTQTQKCLFSTVCLSSTELRLFSTAFNTRSAPTSAQKCLFSTECLSSTELRLFSTTFTLLSACSALCACPAPCHVGYILRLFSVNSARYILRVFSTKPWLAALAQHSARHAIQDQLPKNV